jgi:hypothetical protein
MIAARLYIQCWQALYSDCPNSPFLVVGKRAHHINALCWQGWVEQLPSAWNYWKLWNFALEGITSFTTVPLRVATYLGLIVGIGATVFLLQLLIRTLLFGNPVPGYPTAFRM